jgi:hypothetical protein
MSGSGTSSSSLGKSKSERAINWATYSFQFREYFGFFAVSSWHCKTIQWIEMNSPLGISGSSKSGGTSSTKPIGVRSKLSNRRRSTELTSGNSSPTDFEVSEDQVDNGSASSQEDDFTSKPLSSREMGNAKSSVHSKTVSNPRSSVKPSQTSSLPKAATSTATSKLASMSEKEEDSDQALSEGDIGSEEDSASDSDQSEQGSVTNEASAEDTEASPSSETDNSKDGSFVKSTARLKKKKR